MNALYLVFSLMKQRNLFLSEIGIVFIHFGFIINNLY